MTPADSSSPSYGDVFDAAPGNYLLLDPKMRIVGVTDAYCAATMTVREEILGRNIFEVFPDNPNDPNATGVRNLSASLGRVLTGRRLDRMPVQRYDIRRPAQEGGGFEERYWSPLNSPVLDPDGRLRHIIHAVEDVTELMLLKRKMQEEEHLHRTELRESADKIQEETFLRVEAMEANKRLGESERRYRFLADAVPQLIWTADAEGSAIYFNARWFEFTGLTPDQSKGDGWQAVLHPEDAEATIRAWAHALRDGLDRYEIEHRLRRHDGLYRRMFTVAQPYRNEQGTVSLWFGSTTDIHDRAIAEEQLRQAQRLQSVGKLAGGMAHEVNNMMTVVMGSASFAMGELSPDSEVQKDLQAIIEAANRAGEVTRQLLAYSRQQVLRTTVLDANEVAEQLTGTLSRLIGADRHLEVRPSPVQIRVRGDRTQIEQMLINLVANARDATRAGGIIRLEMDAVEFGGSGADTQGVEAAGAFVRIAVTDDGTGMSADVVARAFEPFFTTKPLGAGTGLGLSMVYGIVNQSGGFARVDSTPGFGTIVSVYLPLVREALTAEEAAAEAPRGKGESVLVVEDDMRVRTVAARALLSYGYTVYEAPNGSAALQFLTTQMGEIDLVLTDIVMPGMSGRDLARTIRARYPNLPVLCMSAYTGDEMTARGITVQGVPFIQKPFTLAALARAVREVLAHAGDPALMGARDLSRL